MSRYIEEKDVRRIIESTDALIALDLAYIDFAKNDYCKIALEYDNVITFKRQRDFYTIYFES